MGPLVLVETREVADEDELMLAFEDFLSQGYEGAIARNAAGPYVSKRSYDLLKVKEFEDKEFKCVGVEEGKGKLAGHAVFVCQTADGTQFRAKMKGAISELKKYFDQPKLVIGKQITVKYQGLTNKNKVPRFPVAWRIAEKL
jgi:ATP-dependent DNA ligase